MQEAFLNKWINTIVPQHKPSWAPSLCLQDIMQPTDKPYTAYHTPWLNTVLLPIRQIERIKVACTALCAGNESVQEGRGHDCPTRAHKLWCLRSGDLWQAICCPCLLGHRKQRRYLSSVILLRQLEKARDRVKHGSLARPPPSALIIDSNWNLLRESLTQCHAAVTKQLPAARMGLGVWCWWLPQRSGLGGGTQRCSPTIVPPPWAAPHHTKHRQRGCSQWETQETKCVPAQALQASKVPSLKFS